MTYALLSCAAATKCKRLPQAWSNQKCRAKPLPRSRLAPSQAPCPQHPRPKRKTRYLRAAARPHHKLMRIGYPIGVVMTPHATGRMAGSGSTEDAGRTTISGGSKNRGTRKAINASGRAAAHSSLRATETGQPTQSTAKTAGRPLLLIIRFGPAAPAGSRFAKHAGQDMCTRNAVSVASLLLQSKAPATSVEYTPAIHASSGHTCVTTPCGAMQS